MRRIGVRLGVDRDGAQAEGAARREHTSGDLAAIGNQNSSDRHLHHIRKTPKFDVPLIGPLAMADKHIPNTVRVSRGSITPSSYSIPDSTIGSDSASIWPSTAARIAASASSSTFWPRPSAAARATIDNTPDSCAPPITADLALGQANRNRGS